MRPILFALTLLLTAAPAWAQIEECTRYKELINDIVTGRDQTIVLVDVQQTARCVALYAAGFERASFEAFVKRFEASRSDEQGGSSGTGTGSTSIVSRGPAAKVLSLAAEHGALTQSVADQRVTVRGNLAGVPAALLRKDIFPYCAGDERLSGFCFPNSVLSTLRRVSFAVAFDPSRDEATITATPSEDASGPAQPVTFSASRRELTSVSVRIEALNRRDVTSPEFVAAWKERVGTAMNTAASDLLSAAGDFVGAVTDAPGYEEWRTQSLARVRAAGTDRTALVAALKQSLELLMPIVQTAVPDYSIKARTALDAYSRFYLAQDELIDSLAMKNVLAFEYSHERPAGMATTSQFRLIGDLPLTAETKLVVNGAITVYHSLPEAIDQRVERIRDARFGVQLDHGLGDVSILGPAVASVALYYQKQNTASVLEIDPGNPLPNVMFVGLPDDVTHVFTRTGDIWLAQAKLSLVPPNKSVKIPLAITYSNRTELVDKPAWSAQIGLTYDFDSLFAGLTSRR